MNSHAEPWDRRDWGIDEVTRGAQRAAQRLEDLGVVDVAHLGAQSVDLSDKPQLVQQLRAEGLAATGRAEGISFQDADALATIEDLAANPWHQGPARRAVETALFFPLADATEQKVPEFRETQDVGIQIESAADHAAVRNAATPSAAPTMRSRAREAITRQRVQNAPAPGQQGPRSQTAHEL